jgi:hypothetical protein
MGMTMKKKPMGLPKFANEDDEATWWASREGRDFIKQKSAESGKQTARGSRLVERLMRPD